MTKAVHAVAVLALSSLACPALAAPEEVRSESRAEPDGSRSLIHEVVVPASPEAVWAAISTAEGWRSWASPNAWVLPNSPDVIETSYNPAGAPGGAMNIKNRVLLKIPNRILAFRTIKAPQGFKNFEALSKVTWVFELIPENSGRTRVRLTGVDFPSDETGREVLAFFDRGNKVSLDFLRARFVDGPLDWAVRLAQARRAEKE